MSKNYITLPSYKYMHLPTCPNGAHAHAHTHTHKQPEAKVFTAKATAVVGAELRGRQLLQHLRHRERLDLQGTRGILATSGAAKAFFQGRARTCIPLLSRGASMQAAFGLQSNRSKDLCSAALYPDDQVLIQVYAGLKDRIPRRKQQFQAQRLW